MKNSGLLLLVFFFCNNAFAQNNRVFNGDTINKPEGIKTDTSINGNTDAEREAIKTAFGSLTCKCSCGTYGEPLNLYKEGRIVMKGCFQQKELMCGIKCTYDKQNKLIQIQKFEDGKYVCDAPIPADANK